MKRDFKTWILLLAFSLPIIAILFIGSIYLVNCGTNNNCARGDLAQVIHTPISTLPAATLPVPSPVGSTVGASGADCTVPAAPLLAAWVKSGSPQTDTFPYSDVNNNPCLATFADIQPLFISSNLWFPGALACTSCHNATLSASAAGLDLSSYAGIKAGSLRSSTTPQRTDILGAGNWQASVLYRVLFVQKQMPVGAPAGSLTDLGPVVPAGITTASLTPTPTAGADEVPEPSNPGPPGPAVDLTGDPAVGALFYKANCAACHGPTGEGNIPNPGSGDGTVPPLNPIDPLLKSPDYRTFASNIDLYIEHGSVPEGANPWRLMPGWGDSNAMSPQHIADVIAYLINLNK